MAVNTQSIDKRYLDTSLSPQQRAAILVAQMTVNEKISQMLHNAPEIIRLEVPEYNWWNESLHGVARAGKATVFPQAIGMAASFNPSLLYRVASAISDEARAKHHDAARRGQRGIYFGLTFWAPNINIFRHPLWGRGHETYGEDPFLTTKMGVAFCKGLQGENERYLKLVATPKHFAVHSGPESLRHEFDAVVSKRDMYETYLPAFKACVEDARAWSVMGAYNRTNGEPCCGSKTLLRDILREEWGFEGYVVSDCWAIKDFHLTHKVTQNAAESAAMAVKNGCELNCGNLYKDLIIALDLELISEKEIDKAVEKLFEARIRLGMFDPTEEVPYANISPEVVCCSEHKDLALQMARESIVLLENKNNTLPLNRQTLTGIGVIGPNAFDGKMQLANYYGLSPNVRSIVEGIVDKSAPGTQVHYCKGCELASQNTLYTLEIEWMMNEKPEVLVAVLGNSAEIEGEEAQDANSDGGGDRTGLSLPGKQQELLEFLVKLGKPVILVLTTGSAVDLNWAKENCAAIINCWYPGEAGGQAVAEVLYGDYNPAGRLPVTFPKSLEQLPHFHDYAMANGHTYRFMKEEPLYRFGYGLSYTTFNYRNLTLSNRDINKDESVVVSVEVCNNGVRGGDEVVQLYVTDNAASVPVPIRSLKGFERIYLAPGEKKTISFTLAPADFSCYDDEGKSFVEAGEFTISVGGGQPGEDRLPNLSTVINVK